MTLNFEFKMSFLKILCLGGATWLLLLCCSFSSGDPEPNKFDAGKVWFKSPSTNYEFEVGNKGNVNKKNDCNFDVDRYTTTSNPCRQRDENYYEKSRNDLAVTNFLTTTTASRKQTTTTAKSTTFKARLIFPGFTAQNMTEPSVQKDDDDERNCRKRRSSLTEDDNVDDQLEATLVPEGNIGYFQLNHLHEFNCMNFA